MGAAHTPLLGENVLVIGYNQNQLYEEHRYRLRKVLVSDLLEHDDQQHTKYVFIVERKKS